MNFAYDMTLPLVALILIMVLILAIVVERENFGDD